jgi:hypothetical protein
MRRLSTRRAKRLSMRAALKVPLILSLSKDEG